MPNRGLYKKSNIKSVFHQLYGKRLRGTLHQHIHTLVQDTDWISLALSALPYDYCEVIWKQKLTQTPIKKLTEIFFNKTETFRNAH